MKFPAYQVAVMCLALGAFSPCRADIAYNLDIPFPFDDGRVTGRLVTDGKLGYLTGYDIIDWDIFLTGEVPVTHTPLTKELQGPGSGSTSAVNWSFFDNPHPLWATATSLFWDFNEDADGSYFLFNGTVGPPLPGVYNGSYLCFGGCGPGGAEGGFPGVEYFQIEDQTNGVQFAIGENDVGDYPLEAPFPFEGPLSEVIASTPEPAAFVPVGLGIAALLGLVAHRRRVQQRSRA